MIAHMSGTKFLDIGDIAELLDIGRPSAQTYHQRARQNRRNGVEKPGDLPEPDRYFGKTPVWKETTIKKWMKNRPGRGAGGGPTPRNGR